MGLVICKEAYKCTFNKENLGKPCSHSVPHKPDSTDSSCDLGTCSHINKRIECVEISKLPKKQREKILLSLV